MSTANTSKNSLSGFALGLALVGEVARYCARQAAGGGRGAVGGDVARYAGGKKSDGSKGDAKPNSNGEHWVTIGGEPEGDKKHVGGTPVKIDGAGNVVAGPAWVAKAGITKLGGGKEGGGEGSGEKGGSDAAAGGSVTGGEAAPAGTAGGKPAGTTKKLVHEDVWNLNGTILKDKNGNEYVPWGYNNGILKAHPIVNGKAAIHKSTEKQFNIDSPLQHLPKDDLWVTDRNYYREQEENRVSELQKSDEWKADQAKKQAELEKTVNQSSNPSGSAAPAAGESNSSSASAASPAPAISPSHITPETVPAKGSIVTDATGREHVVTGSGGGYMFAAPIGDNGEVQGNRERAFNLKLSDRNSQAFATGRMHGVAQSRPASESGGGSGGSTNANPSASQPETPAILSATPAVAPSETSPPAPAPATAPVQSGTKSAEELAQLVDKKLLYPKAIEQAKKMLSITAADSPKRAEIQAEINQLQSRWDAEQPNRDARKKLENAGWRQSDYNEGQWYHSKTKRKASTVDAIRMAGLAENPAPAPVTPTPATAPTSPPPSPTAPAATASPSTSSEKPKKQPWEMTAEEFSGSGKPNYGDMVHAGGVVGFLRGGDSPDRAKIVDANGRELTKINTSDATLIRRQGTGTESHGGTNRIDKDFIANQARDMEAVRNEYRDVLQKPTQSLNDAEKSRLDEANRKFSEIRNREIKFDPSTKSLHRMAVESALAAGKDVPAHVLSQYPDLKAPAPVSASSPTATTPTPPTAPTNALSASGEGKTQAATSKAPVAPKSAAKPSGATQAKPKVTGRNVEFDAVTPARHAGDTDGTEKRAGTEYSIPGYEGIRFVASKNPWGGYKVFEANTGLEVGNGDTQQAAIDDTTKKMDKFGGADAVRREIQDRLSKRQAKQGQSNSGQSTEKAKLSQALSLGIALRFQKFAGSPTTLAPEKALYSMVANAFSSRFQAIATPTTLLHQRKGN